MADYSTMLSSSLIPAALRGSFTAFMASYFAYRVILYAQAKGFINSSTKRN